MNRVISWSLFAGYLICVFVAVAFDIAVGLAGMGLVFWFRLDMIEDSIEEVHGT